MTERGYRGVPIGKEAGRSSRWEACRSSEEKVADKG